MHWTTIFEMNQIVTHLIAFLVGALTGAAGAYLGAKFTDRRREAEAKKKEREQFARVRNQMPKLIAEMKNDLSDPETRYVREFLITDGRIIPNPSAPCFHYKENEHEGLRGKAHILENIGFIIDVTHGSLPRYRMTEAFVNLILKDG
jgi:hypothetical protein